MKEKIAEVFKEYRQYLYDTEFAPPPFDDVPVDPAMVNEVFPNKIIELFKEDGFELILRRDDARDI